MHKQEYAFDPQSLVEAAVSAAILQYTTRHACLYSRRARDTPANTDDIA